MDDLDFDDVFQDDDEGAAEHEVEDEEVKDSKDRVKKEIKDFAIGTQEVDEEMLDESGKLTSEGKVLYSAYFCICIHEIIIQSIKIANEKIGS